MNKIEFIPLVELATEKDAESERVPHGNPFDNSTEWNLYQRKEIEKNYLNVPEPVSPSVFQYKLLDLDIADIERAINLHIADTDINESCSLFGGYAISLNGTIELYPQCCGLLEEIQDWKNILNENFADFYLKECHPSPLIRKMDDQILIVCKDDFEAFLPPVTKKIIKLDYQETKLAFLKLLETLTVFSAKLNSLSHKYHTNDLSNILIWGRNERRPTSEDIEAMKH